MVEAQTVAQVAPAQRVSRTGKKLLAVPTGVTVTFNGQKVSVKGPKGSLEREFQPCVEFVKDAEGVTIKLRSNAGLEGAKFQGLSRALFKNMIDGVSKGYTISMDLIGTGYRAEVKGQDVTLALGLSHPVNYKLPDSVKAKVEIIDTGGTKKPRLHLESYDKEAIGQVAARVRSFRPPEPYKGKGVRYLNEKVREKAGKAGKAKK